jgi:hypothetical protein
LLGSVAQLIGGSKKTVKFAHKKDKPYLHLHCGQQDAVDALKTFVNDNLIRVLNVAGPSGSKEPAVAEFVIEVLDGALGSRISCQRKKIK